MNRQTITRGKPISGEALIYAMESLGTSNELRKELEALAGLSSEELSDLVKREMPHIHQIIEEALEQQFGHK